MTLSFRYTVFSIKLVTGCVAVLIFGLILFRLAFPFRDTTFPAYMELRGERFTLQIAATEAQREKGLGDRESLCETCAMLFVFEKSGQHAFWMKDMHFPLDIVWLSKDDKVVFVAHEVSSDFLGILNPAIAADHVIEFNAGVAKNLNVGDIVQFFYYQTK